jgi:ABC-2 type transport system permease protein
MSTATVAPAPLRPSPAPVGQTFGTDVRDVLTMVGRETRRTLRSVDGLVTAFVIPISIMLVFVVVFGGAIEDDGSYIDYVVPGTLVLCLGFGSAMTAVSVAQDMTSGTIDRFRTLAIFREAALWGHVLASVARNLLSAVVVMAVAMALGYRPEASPRAWLAVLGYVVLVVLTFTWLSCAAGLVLSVDAAGTVNVAFLFLPYLSSGFVAVATMPVWLHGFAENQPFTPIIETLRGLLGGTSTGDWLGPALGWLIGILVVSYAAAAVLHRRRTAR